MSSSELSISYDGDSLRAGLMDVQELAPALLATGTLIQEANRLINGDTTHTDLKVKSDFRRGSFLVTLVVDQSLLEQAKNFLLQHPGIKDAKEILETLFFYTGMPLSLFKLIKFLGGKKPDKIAFETEGGNVNVIKGDQNVVVNKNTYNLYLNPEVRRAADRIVAPLNSEGIETLEIRRENEVERVNKEEASFFSYSELEGELLLNTVSQSWLSIISLSFNPENKWRFTTGGSVFYANVTDEQFWDKVHKHVVKFAEGDQLLVALRTATARDDKGILRTRYTVEKVLEHVAAPKQSRLNLQ